MAHWISFGFSRRPCLSNEVEKDCRRKIMSSPVFHMNIREHTCNRICTIHIFLEGELRIEAW